MTYVPIIADDYGLSRAVNRGIEELAGAGMIDGVSIMAHRDADHSTLDRLRATAVELGVHLVLVEELPLLPLCEGDAEARLPDSYGSLFWALLRDPALASRLALEAGAQVALLKSRGVRLRFLNSHQHVHMFPPLWRALRPLMERERLRVRVSRRIRFAPLKQCLVDLAGTASWTLWPLVRCETVRPVGIEFAGHFSQPAATRLGARLCRSQQLEECEVVVHPGHEDAVLRSRYAHWNYQWSEEFRVLSSGAVRSALRPASAL